MAQKAATAGKAQKSAILLVDDHPMVRERLAEVIATEPDLLVCGEAESRHEALEAIAAHPPDLVIIDLTLKNSDGMELIKDIRSRWPRLAMLVVSMHDESLYAERVIRAGALGYITKQEATRNILLAIRRVLQGGVYVNDKILSRIVARFSDRNRGRGSGAEVLTDRELQVLELTGQGLSIREIARRLHIGNKTVETYRTRIREKLHLKSSTELLPLAISWVHHR